MPDQRSVTGSCTAGSGFPSSRPGAPVDSCCQHCCQAAGRHLSWADKPGTSAQSADTTGRSWTTCRNYGSVKNSDSGLVGAARSLVGVGFEDPNRPLLKLIDAFEAIATRTVSLGPRVEAPLAELIHPVFATGRVFAWEILTAEVTATAAHAEPSHRTIGLTHRGSADRQPARSQEVVEVQTPVSHPSGPIGNPTPADGRPTYGGNVRTHWRTRRSWP